MNAIEAAANVYVMDQTDREQESRRELLRRWLADHGEHAKVVADRKLSPSQASYISQLVNGYSFGPRAARNMEKRLGMPPKWLDQDLASVAPPMPAPAQIPGLPQAIERIGMELARDMAEEVRQDVADALHKLAMRRGSALHQGQVLELLASLQGKQRSAA